MRRFRITRFALPSFFEFLQCCLIGVILTCPEWSAAEGASSKTTAMLVADLESSDFETREAAMHALKERIEAITQLRKARRSSDPEVRRRVDDILTALEKKLAVYRLRKSKALGDDGRVVEIADRLAFAAKWGVAGYEGWESLTQFADQAITKTERFFPHGWAFPRNQELPCGAFRQYVKSVNPKELAQRKIDIDTGHLLNDMSSMKVIANRMLIREVRGKLLLRGEEVSLTGRNPPIGLEGGMIASSGDVQISGAMNSVIVAGGNLQKVERLLDCILICDGDVELLSGWDITGIIIARGKVTWKKGRIRNCLIRSGQTLRLPGGPLPNEKIVEIKDGTPDPLSFVKFFELADVGLAAEDLPARENSDTDGVRLKDVRKDSPFASGLRAGDVITAIEDKKTPTTEIFRRVLRRTLAQGDPLITFTVWRAGKTLEVPIAVKD